MHLAMKAEGLGQPNGKKNTLLHGSSPVHSVVKEDTRFLHPALSNLPPSLLTHWHASFSLQWLPPTHLHGSSGPGFKQKNVVFIKISPLAHLDNVHTFISYTGGCTIFKISRGVFIIIIASKVITREEK